MDDLVLDITAFKANHPGGRFVLTHNIGRDISKFFYGGYSLEGNLGRKPAEGFAHSYFAKLIVNEIAIARYHAGKEPVDRVPCRIVEELTANVNSTTKTVVFESLD